MSDETTPQDDAAMSPASAGSDSVLPASTALKDLAEKVNGMTFFGVPVHELGRDDLLAIIGYLADQGEQERKRHRSYLDFLKAASAASK